MMRREQTIEGYAAKYPTAAMNRRVTRSSIALGSRVTLRLAVREDESGRN